MTKSSVFFGKLFSPLNVLVFFNRIGIHTIIKSTFIKSRLRWRKKRITMSGISWLLEFIKLLFNCWFLFRRLLKRWHEFTHQRRTTFTHWRCPDFVSTCFFFIQFLFLFLLRKCPSCLKLFLFFLFLWLFFSYFLIFLKNIS